MRSADRGFSTVDGDGAVDAGRRRQTAAILQQVLNVLNDQVNSHYSQHRTHSSGQ